MGKRVLKHFACLLKALVFLGNERCRRFFITLKSFKTLFIIKKNDCQPVWLFN